MTLYAPPVRKVSSPRAALIADAQARGVIALQCEECGYRHPLSRLGYGCNAAHPTQDGDTCEGWNLKEIKGVVA
ncbi:hypothetical protein [uncultured Deinococcus sp.]|uniref:hypothetical protein n=1 Tax=uncultured Deinococcus sp. TaxID=158789 RepID=UPI0025FB2557|nr:hypothetical protein [uncultured Deinococcus sp.]